MTTVQILGLSLGLAFLTESMVEYVFGQAVDHFQALSKFRWALMYVALGAGVGLSLYYGIDLLAVIAEQPATVVGQVMTGLIVGRGANYLHDFVSAYLIQPKFG